MRPPARRRSVKRSRGSAPSSKSRPASRPRSRRKRRPRSPVDRCCHPARRPRERDDARDLPFVTIDPPGSLDLDQAFHAERRRRRLPRPLRDRRRRRVRRARAARSTASRSLAASRCTCPTAGRRCCPNQARSGRRQPACPTRNVRRCCGRSTSTRPARRRRPASSGRRFAAAPRSTTRACRPRLDRGDADEPLVLLREIGRGCDAISKPSAVASASTSPRRRSSPTEPASYAPRVRRARCRSRRGTRRSRCSRGWKRPGSWSTPRVGILRTLPPSRSPSTSIDCAASRGALDVHLAEGRVVVSVVRGLDRSRRTTPRS